MNLATGKRWVGWWRGWLLCLMMGVVDIVLFGQIYCFPPLHVAAGRGDLPRVQALLKRAGDANRVWGYCGTTALYWAVKNEHYEVAKSLLERGASPNIDCYGEALISVPLCKGDTSMTLLLLQHGLDLGRKDCRGLKPLRYAEDSGSTVVVRAMQDRLAR